MITGGPAGASEQSASADSLPPIDNKKYIHLVRPLMTPGHSFTGGLDSHKSDVICKGRFYSFDETFHWIPSENKNVLTKGQKGMIDDLRKQIADILSLIAGLHRSVKRLTVAISFVYILILSAVSSVLISRYVHSKPSISQTIESRGISEYKEISRAGKEEVRKIIVGRILYASNDFRKLVDLYEYTGIKEFRNSAHADWSPEGDRMAFISITGSESQGDLFIYTPKNNNIESLPFAGNEIRFPKFSPDGKSLVYSIRNDLRWDIAKIDIDGGTPVWLTGDKSNNPSAEKEFSRFNRYDNPRWSPDGKYIVFCGTKDRSDTPPKNQEGFFLFIMKSDGSDRRFICPTGRMCDPVFSPSGNFLAFRSAIDNKYNDIWIVPMDDGKCISDKTKIKGRISRLDPLDGHFVKKIVLEDKSGRKNIGGRDPFWVSDEELMFLYSTEFKEETTLYSTSEINGWIVRIYNIADDTNHEYRVLDKPVRNPKTIAAGIKISLSQ